MLTYGKLSKLSSVKRKKIEISLAIVRFSSIDLPNLEFNVYDSLAKSINQSNQNQSAKESPKEENQEFVEKLVRNAKNLKSRKEEIERLRKESEKSDAAIAFNKQNPTDQSTKPTPKVYLADTKNYPILISQDVDSFATDLLHAIDNTATGKSNESRKFLQQLAKTLSKIDKRITSSRDVLNKLKSNQPIDKNEVINLLKSAMKRKQFMKQYTTKETDIYRDANYFVVPGFSLKVYKGNKKNKSLGSGPRNLSSFKVGGK